MRALIPRRRLIVESLHEGFELPEARLAVYTDHQLFNRYHRPTARKRARAKGGLSLREVQALRPGDFVVHVDYGIGKFAGLQTITVRERKQEAVRLIFAGQDELFVNLSALHKLHKYTGKEGHQPALTKLGTGAWDRLKSRTKKRVKDIARDLIKIYAARKAAAGYAFKGDTIWQRELEASFEYEETVDQAAAIEAVKAGHAAADADGPPRLRRRRLRQDRGCHPRCIQGRAGGKAGRRRRPDDRPRAAAHRDVP